MKQSGKTSSIKLKKKRSCSKSNENKLNLEINFGAAEKLEQKIFKEKNGKRHRDGLNEVFNQYSNVFETINSTYKNKNLSISPNRHTKSRSNSFQKHSAADLKQGSFSFKQSIVRPKKTIFKSFNWRTEVACPTPVSVFGYVPQFSSLATHQDTELDGKLRRGNFKLSAWQKLMREMDSKGESNK